MMSAACPAHPGSVAYRQIVIRLICVGGFANSYNMFVSEGTRLNEKLPPAAKFPAPLPV